MVRRKDRAAGPLVLPGYRDPVEIGGGAFATVYRAIEDDTGRPVALKVLKVDTIHPHLMEVFAREIQALAKVSDHPNIVTLYRPLATPDGRPVLVLELCRESLAEQVRRAGPIGATEVTRIGIKIAGALETAHRHGFLHRDLQPRHILLTQFGEPALGDFGVAALQASAQATAGVFGFTTLHAAPEILEGHHLSPATDVYGLASTMYELLSGLAPFATFEGEAPASVILRIIRDPVRPLRGEDIPIGLSDLLEVALAKDPERRPPRASEFADALLAVEAGAGWAPTAYVAWGHDDPARPAPAPVPARAAGPSLLPRPPAPPAGPLYPSPPSVTVPDVAVQRPTFREPGPPVSRRPSVAAPVTPARRVVVPDQSARGPARTRESQAVNPPLAPLRPPAASPAAERPVFVDPPAVGSPPGGPFAPAESVFEQTIFPGAGGLPPPRPAAPTMTRTEQLMASPVLLAGLAAAGLVIVAAVLLILGVL